MGSGYSQIYAFPFRIYGESHDSPLIGTATSGHKVRLYPLFQVRPDGVALIPHVPKDLWPEFEWSPACEMEERLPPPTSLAPAPALGKRLDGMRLDVYGAEAEGYSSDFKRRFLAGLRLQSGQSWIGEYEPHCEADLKHSFAVDQEGLAVGAPYTYGKAMTASHYMRPVTPELCERAFLLALTNTEPPSYWMAFHDAGVEWGYGKYPEVVLQLVLALEMARDTIFSFFAPTRERPGVGFILDKPFEGTDLLAHLGKRLEKFCNRSLEREVPQLWEVVRSLYVVRHHVAHGKPAAYRVGREWRSVGEAEVRLWMPGVYQVLMWMGSLAEDKIATDVQTARPPDDKFEGSE